MRPSHETDTKVTEALLDRMNIGRRYWGAKLEDLPEESKSTLVIRRYISALQKCRTEGRGLFLWGANGMGKTYAAAAVLRAAVSRGYSAYAVLTDILKSAYIEKTAFDPDETIVHRVQNVEFLLLDDFGKEYHGKGSDWARMQMENLLRLRTRELMPTIITTNLSPKAFREKYGNSAFSIILECATPVEVKYSEDIRARLAKGIDPIGGK